MEAHRDWPGDQTEDLNEVFFHAASSQKEWEDLNLAVKKKNYEILKGYLNSGVGNKKKKIVIHFLESPVEIKGASKVEKIVLERNELTGEPGDQKAKGTGEGAGK